MVTFEQWFDKNVDKLEDDYNDYCFCCREEHNRELSFDDYCFSKYEQSIGDYEDECYQRYRERDI